MKIQWCWRCRMDVPMLDEDEFAIVEKLYREGLYATKEFRKKHGLPLADCPIETRFIPVLDAYQAMTGMRETNANAVMHRRISLYGPPCPGCGKVLRTVTASKCFECGYVVDRGRNAE